MTSFEIQEFRFERDQLQLWSDGDARYRNWPVVYTLGSSGEVYVGESLNVVRRLFQHLDSDKQRLGTARVVLDGTFNKSAALDLESYLIRLFAGDGRFAVLNRNDGIVNAEYFERPRYQETFDAIFAELRELGLFTRPVREIENTDLFKLSPFKALTNDQAIAVEDILEGLFDDLQQGVPSEVVVRGDPGTGKTVVGIYLMKLLSDIAHADVSQPVEGDSAFSDFFVEGYPKLLEHFRIGLVVPQQSLRKSIQKVFAKTPGLDPTMVVTPFQVGLSDERYDLLIVDEAHRLNQRASQASGVQNGQYVDINVRLFGADDLSLTQLDWLRAKSDHQIYLLDAAQSVRPADLPREVLDLLVERVTTSRRLYPLTSQMRVRGGADYVGYVRAVLSGGAPTPTIFDGYDLRFFDSFPQMVAEVRRRDAEVGLSRLLAGYAWPWNSKTDTSAYDIEIEGVQLRWNGTDVDWVSSIGSLDEVGSIHTIQGYDLNYAGVVIGPDLRFDPGAGRMVFARDSYFDKRGKRNNPTLGVTYSDDDLLEFVRNIYAVLLTRGIQGTYVYVCDRPLREHLRPLFETQGLGSAPQAF